MACGSNTVNIFNNGTGPVTGLRFQLERYPTTSEQSYTADKLANSWSGAHDLTCLWNRTNTVYGDPTADASCALVEKTNSNFGTVTSVAGLLPGITFTPSRVGRYWVCALAKVHVGTANVIAATRLWDGTTVISEHETVHATTSNGGELTHSLCGIYVVTNTSAKTLSIQSKIGSGTVAIGALGGSSAIEWSIFQIDQSFPAPNLVNSVVSPSSGVMRIMGASVSSGGVVSNETGDWISGNCTPSSNSITCTLVTGTFSAAPVCTFIPSTLGLFLGKGTQSSTTILYYGYNDAGVGVVAGADVICIGPK